MGGSIPPEVLARIPGCEDGRAPLAVQALPGGRGVNRVLRVDTPQGRFVWRCRSGESAGPGSPAWLELGAQRLAAAAGLAPTLVAAAPDGQWLLMEYIDAPSWSHQQLHSVRGVQVLGRRLAQLHSLAVPGDWPGFDPVAIARRYLERLEAGDAAQAREGAQVLARVEVLAGELRSAGPGRALVHGDLVISNMLGPQPLLIDWEYVQVADPGWDIASLLGYYPDLVLLSQDLLDAAGLDGAHGKARLALQYELFGLLNRLWLRGEGAS